MPTKETTEKRKKKKDKEMEGVKGSGDLIQTRDTYRIAYIIHFFLGAGNLLPWNALITAVDYFSYLYPNRHVERVLSVVYMTCSLLVLVVLLSWGGLRKMLSFRVRMNLGFVMFVVSLMVTPTMDWTMQKKMGSSSGYEMVVLSVATCGLADGLIAGSLIGTAGKLPKQYMQAIFAGTASSGILISILRIITKASLPQTPQGLRTSAHFYFIVSTTILLGCIICCNLLYKLPVMQQHYNFLQDGLIPFSKPKFRETAKEIRWPVFGIILIYTITLSIFPGFLAENIQSTLLKDWYPILLIALYNLSDFVGKSLTAIYVLKSIRKATWGCIARLLFYPLFTACLRGPKWLKTEFPVGFLTAMLGLSNGYLTSVLMILAPKGVPSSEGEIAAIVMVVFLGIGLVAGSVLGWFWII